MGHQVVLSCTFLMNFYFSVEHVYAVQYKLLVGGGEIELIVPYITISAQSPSTCWLIILSLYLRVQSIVQVDIADRVRTNLISK